MKKYQTENPCLVCREEFMDRTFHHVKSRRSGGPDEPWNLMPLCLSHHNEVHNKGLTTFSARYSQVEAWLINHGWETDPYGDWFMPLS